MTTARLLDLTALAAGAWLGGALLFWSGRSGSFWTRPEHVFVFLLGIVALRILVAPVPGPELEPRRVVAVGVALYLGAWDLVGALPALAQNLLSRDPVLYNHRTQYQAFVLPFLILAAITGYSRLAARRGGQWPVAIQVVAFMGSLGLASSLANELAVARWWPSADQRLPTRCWRDYHRPRRSPPRIAMYRT